MRETRSDAHILSDMFFVLNKMPEHAQTTVSDEPLPITPRTPQTQEHKRLYRLIRDNNHTADGDEVAIDVQLPQIGEISGTESALSRTLCEWISLAET